MTDAPAPETEVLTPDIFEVSAQTPDTLGSDSQPLGTTAVIDAAEYAAATTRRIGKRTVTVAIELPSGMLTGEPNRSADGLWVALCHPWTDEDRLCMEEMFAVSWVDALPEGWDAPAA